MGHDDHGHHDHDDHHHEEGFFRKYVWSHDHKMIGRQFLITTLLWLFVGGALALIVRWQLAYPGEEIPVLGDILAAMYDDSARTAGGDVYNMAFTMHASVMIFLVIIPMLVGAFGNFCVPLMIGARDMAFPFLNALSYWVMWPAFVLFGMSFVAEGAAGAPGSGWTAYPPLSYVAGEGQTLWCMGVILVGAGSVMGAVNYITTIVTMRAPGMRLFRMPLTVWSIFITSILSLLATPVLSSAMIMLLCDRIYGSSFFVPAGLSAGLDETTNVFNFASGGGNVVL